MERRNKEIRTETEERPKTSKLDFLCEPAADGNGKCFAASNIFREVLGVTHFLRNTHVVIARRFCTTVVLTGSANSALRRAVCAASTASSTR